MFCLRQPSRESAQACSISSASTTRSLMGVLFLLIIPSFVLFGVRSLSRRRPEGREGRSAWTVTTSRVRNGMRSIATRSIAFASQSPNVDPALLDSDAARYATLERMVRDRVLAAAAAKTNMSVSEERPDAPVRRRCGPGVLPHRGRHASTASCFHAGHRPDARAVRSRRARAAWRRSRCCWACTGTAFATPAQAAADARRLLRPPRGAGRTLQARPTSRRR